MNAKHREFRDDPTEGERRKNLSPEEIREFELAGGVEGGMQAGSAGGPDGDAARGNSDSSSAEISGKTKAPKERPRP